MQNLWLTESLGNSIYFGDVYGWLSTTYVLYIRHIRSIEFILDLICHCCMYQISTGDHEMSNVRGTVAVSITYFLLLNISVFCCSACLTARFWCLSSCARVWKHGSEHTFKCKGALIYLFLPQSFDFFAISIILQRHLGQLRCQWYNKLHILSACSSKSLSIRSTTFID